MWILDWRAFPDNCVRILRENPGTDDDLKAERRSFYRLRGSRPVVGFAPMKCRWT
jgi:hypothetical protein